MSYILTYKKNYLQQYARHVTEETCRIENYAPSRLRCQMLTNAYQGREISDNIFLYRDQSVYAFLGQFYQFIEILH